MSNYAHSLKYLLVIVPMAFAFTACGGNSSGLYEVKGRLTHDGQPIPEMMIYFIPEDTGNNPESYATTDAEGRFEMKVVNTPGVAPGKHTVYVQDPAAVQGGQTSTDAGYLAVLEKYGAEETSPYTITVEEDLPDLELKLD
ncbi:carboxypeptidase-like regulatory domain-containing protein [Bremerella sp. P1]|uniref:carboxypeptidase-like regulatory domain-containing protein n=1 Tax=Bremerella sp. P1 TaxID=3026424 RepID=UPI002367B4CB|nr:carboxypeptidase-like regulatory domain-containing protein [Bremerella sp. P1]WDI42145.1 carboxypeptidase-like regulatory domain-containing protein [Bremerella sp. P1]